MGQVNWKQVGISSLTGGVLSYFSYKVGSWVSGNLNIAFNQLSIESPVVKGIVSGAASYAAGGYVGNYVGTLVLTGDPEMAKQNAWKGLYTNLATGAVFGGVGAYQYAKGNKISPWTGEKIQRHHSDPIFLGGDERQSLTPMSESRHRALHREMNQYLKEQTNESGYDMQPRRNNPGRQIRENFNRNIRFDATIRFYDQNRFRYWDARRDFYNINKLK